MAHAATGTLTIDLQALRENVEIIRGRLAQGARLGASVKSNAYGLGALQITGALVAQGVEDFFVATPQEALKLRERYPRIRIMVLNGFYNSHAGLYADHGLIPVLGSFLEIEGYKALAGKYQKKLPAYLHFNTRMNRLGLGSVETEELLSNMAMLDGLDVVGIMSHFACADEANNPMTETQYELFAEIAQKFPEVEKSLCNSSGVFRDPKYHFDLVRPGMALYGLNPTPEQDNPMKAVVGLEVPVMRLRLVYKGATTGYNATYCFDKDTWLATVAAGYTDGIFWSLANQGFLYWKGYECPIRGRVSMDMTTVDLSNVPEGERPKPGDVLEVLGPHQSADDLAKAAGTIGYEVLTSLGNRYHRSYVGEVEEAAAMAISS